MTGPTQAAFQRHRDVLNAAFDDFARACGVHRLTAWLTRRLARRR